MRQLPDTILAVANEMQKMQERINTLTRALRSIEKECANRNRSDRERRKNIMDEIDLVR